MGSYLAFSTSLVDQPALDYLSADDQSRMIFFAKQPDGVTTLDRQQCRPMIAADFPGSVSHRWVREGFCALFDAADVSASGEMHFHPDAHIRTLLDTLADAGTAGRVKLQSLFKASNTAFAKDALLDEALAREMMRFLSTRNQLWDWYHAWHDGVATDPTGEALLAVTGNTPEQLNGEFEAWATSPGAMAR